MVRHVVRSSCWGWSIRLEVVHSSLWSSAAGWSIHWRLHPDARWIARSDGCRACGETEAHRGWSIRREFRAPEGKRGKRARAKKIKGTNSKDIMVNKEKKQKLASCEPVYFFVCMDAHWCAVQQATEIHAKNKSSFCLFFRRGEKKEKGRNKTNSKNMDKKEKKRNKNWQVASLFISLWVDALICCATNLERKKSQKRKK